LDGTSGDSKYYVDNFTLEENAALAQGLHEVTVETG
jgi:hypothetical protein